MFDNIYRIKMENATDYDSISKAYHKARREKKKAEDPEGFREKHRERMAKYIQKLREEQPEHYRDLIMRQQVAYWRRKKRDLPPEKFNLHFARLILRRPDMAAIVRAELDLTL